MIQIIKNNILKLLLLLAIIPVLNNIIRFLLSFHKTTPPTETLFYIFDDFFNSFKRDDFINRYNNLIKNLDKKSIYDICFGIKCIKF
jgi:hypothetical protein